MSGMNPVRLVARFNGARLLFLADAHTWADNGRGWARRVGNNLLEA
jgi:lysozyme family protein